MLLEYLEKTGVQQKLEEQAEELAALGFWQRRGTLGQVYEALARLINQAQTLEGGRFRFWSCGRYWRRGLRRRRFPSFPGDGRGDAGGYNPQHF